MLRMGTVICVGMFAASLFLACGDKNDPLSPYGAGGMGGGSPGIDGGMGGSPAVSFAADIMPLLQKSCSCHVTGSVAPALNNYANAKAAADASNSAIQEGSMPIAGPLSESDKALFQSWVSAGAPNN
jgi:hypothetical protein